MIEFLTKSEVQKYIKDHHSDDTAKLALQAHKHPDWPFPEVLNQIKSRQKANNKLPSWYNVDGLIYPPPLSMEQCSSEQTALYKASLIGGKTMADLTGGFGVDSAFLSASFKSTIYVERDQHLANIARHNFAQLNKQIDVVNKDALEFVKSSGTLDFIYLDPARRDAQKRKIVALEDYSPNLIVIKTELLNVAETVMVKTSPMLDIKLAVSQLGLVSEVHVVSVKNEVKELLFILQGDLERSHIPKISAINLVGKQDVPFTFTFEEEQKSQSAYAEVQEYLYEPNSSILKAGAFKSVGERFNILKLHQHSHLYSSNDLIKDFPGRSFKVEEVMGGISKAEKKRLKKVKANVLTRNYNQSAQQLKARFNIQDGGESYLIGTKTNSGFKLLIAKRLN